MSTVTITQMMTSNTLNGIRIFSSLFDQYRTLNKPKCPKCRKKRNMNACVTLLRTAISHHGDVVKKEFGLPEEAKLTVFLQGTAFGVIAK